jgi:hypothetical protein
MPIVLTTILKFHVIAVSEKDVYDPGILSMGGRNRFKVTFRTQGEFRSSESELHATLLQNLPALIRGGGRRERSAEFAQLDVSAERPAQRTVGKDTPESAEFDVIQPVNRDPSTPAEQDKNQAGERFVGRLQ